MSFLDQPLQDILLAPSRKIGNINVQVVINENTNDTLTITKQPVQQGASITDHAYKEPTTLNMQIFFQTGLSSITGLSSLLSNSNGLAQLYQTLLDLQISRVPFDISTPKRIYKNMLLAVISQTTDRTTENCLSINASFQEIIIVNISTVTVPRSRQKNPGATGRTEAAGKKSALVSIKEGIGALAR